MADDENDEDSVLEQGEERGSVQLNVDPDITTFDRARLIEITATWLALGILGVFAGSVGTILMFAVFGDSSEALEIGQVVLPFSSTPLAVAIGYYFGVAGRR